MKKVLKYMALGLAIAPMCTLLVACGGNDDKLLRVTPSDSPFVSTQTTYYVGDEFNPSKTYVDFIYFDKSENTEWTLEGYALTQLHREIDDIEYTVDGFDTSVPCENQEITLTFTSQTYSNEIYTSFSIKILPEYVVDTVIEYGEEEIKSQFTKDETLNFEELTIINTYSNGRVEEIPVSSSMVSGFDTSSVSATRRTMTISTGTQTLEHGYVVAPSDDYTLFSEVFVKCFVPSSEMGFE